MSLEVELAQAEFMARGGVMQMALTKKYKSGELVKPGKYEWQEYPKMLRLNPREEEIEQKYFIGNSQTPNVSYVTRLVYDEIVVNSEDEEERVLSGGKTAGAIEAERQELLAKARLLGLRVDSNWSVVRLRREMGDKMGSVETQAQVEALLKERDSLRMIADLQAEIEALKAGRAGSPNEVEELRAELTAVGVDVDRRWGAARLREELERVTAPVGKAA
jgi:hypothetical protein